MKTNFGVTCILTAFVVFLASPVEGQIQVLTPNQLARVFNQLKEVDFEDLPETNPALGPQLPNPLRLNGATFTDRYVIDAGFCSSPTCEPDPDNAHGGNIALFLNWHGSISFAQPRRIVVLDLQGNGSNTITFRVVDARGRQRRVVAQAIEYATTVVGLSSPVGIRKVEVLPGEPGPVALARILFSDPIPRYRPVPNGPPRWPTRR